MWTAITWSVRGVTSFGYTPFLCTAEPLNKGHFGDDINSADLVFVERFSSLGGSKCIVGTTLGP